MLSAKQGDLPPVPRKWHIGHEPMLRSECRLDPGASDIDDIHVRDRETRSAAEGEVNGTP